MPIDYSSFFPVQRPELHSEDALRRAKEAGQKLSALPQILRLPDGRIMDSYDYLKTRRIDIIADQYPGWEKETDWWYATILPDGYRGQPGAVVTGGFGDEAEEIFSIRNRRADAHNAISKTKIRPYIEIFSWDEVAPMVYPPAKQ